MVHEGGATVYREWAPGAVEAQLIGDFNGWQGQAMERDDFGTWSIRCVRKGWGQYEWWVEARLIGAGRGRRRSVTALAPGASSKWVAAR